MQRQTTADDGKAREPFIGLEGVPTETTTPVEMQLAPSDGKMDCAELGVVVPNESFLAFYECSSTDTMKPDVHAIANSVRALDEPDFLELAALVQQRAWAKAYSRLHFSGDVVPPDDAACHG